MIAAAHFGRLLVGLRWWNDVKDDGSNVWVFESKPVSTLQCGMNKSSAYHLDVFVGSIGGAANQCIRLDDLLGVLVPDSSGVSAHLAH